MIMSYNNVQKCLPTDFIIRELAAGCALHSIKAYLHYARQVDAKAIVRITFPCNLIRHLFTYLRRRRDKSIRLRSYKHIFHPDSPV
jgi:hypothetical protein